MIACALLRALQRREIHQAMILRRDDPIALAARLLEKRALYNLQRAPRLPHEGAAIESLRVLRYPDFRYRNPPGGEIVGERKVCIVEPVTGQKEPTRQTFFKPVTGTAQYGLRVLEEQCADIVHQLLAKRRTFVH